MIHSTLLFVNNYCLVSYQDKNRIFDHFRGVKTSRLVIQYHRPKDFKTLLVKSSLADASQHHFLHVNDLTSSQLLKLLETALNMKRQLKREKKYREKLLDGKTLAMIFAKPSARTRISFETGSYLRLWLLT